MPVKLASYQVEIKPASVWSIVAARDVLEVSGVAETSGNRDNALAFGDDSALKVTVALRRGTLASVPDDLPIRVTFTIADDYGTHTARCFVGLVTNAQRALSGSRWTLECEGLAYLIRKTRIASVAFFRRPAATRTTAASVEDPTAVGYRAGAINYLLWQAGGRPAEQDFAYPDATFYYSCDQAILAADWTWFNGEDGWEEALRLVRASAGQLYQGMDGVIRYRQPLAFGADTPLHTFADTGAFSASRTLYKDLQERKPTRKTATAIKCAFVGRRVLPLQQVVEDTTPRLVHVGETLAPIVLEPQLPLATLETATATTLKSDAILAVFGDSSAVPQGLGGYSHSLEITDLGLPAQRITLTLTNTTARPFVIYRITLRGEPIGPVESGSVVVGSGATTLDIEDSPYIQHYSHAERLCTIYLAFSAAGRSVYTISGCPYDPNRTLGEAVYLSCAEWSLTNRRCIIVAIRHSRTGAISEYDLVYVGDLPKTSDLYRVGSTNYAGQSLRLGY